MSVKTIKHKIILGNIITVITAGLILIIVSLFFIFGKDSFVFLNGKVREYLTVLFITIGGFFS